jgi:PadR family transcriptional regulator, regulatory protein PadR
MRRFSSQTWDVLSCMLQTPNERHYGLEIMQKTGLKSGTLYPVLQRLETQKLLESEWETIDPVAEGRKPRRYYTLTNLGLRMTRQEIQLRQINLTLISPILEAR